MRVYTVAFIFTEDFNKILLIQPNRPEWQVGKLHGPGGKLESDETPAECMSREVREETALDISPEAWKPVAVEHHEGAEIHFFTAIYSGDVADATQLTDEPIAWYQTMPLPEQALPNLRWLIPLAIDILKRGAIEHVRYEMPVSQAELHKRSTHTTSS